MSATADEQGQWATGWQGINANVPQGDVLGGQKLDGGGQMTYANEQLRRRVKVKCE